MPIYIITETVDYGEYTHIVRAKDKAEAKNRE